MSHSQTNIKEKKTETDSIEDKTDTTTVDIVLKESQHASVNVEMETLSEYKPSVNISL